MSRTIAAAIAIAIVAAGWLAAGCASATVPATLATPPPGRSVIIVVWDGLRPDTIDPAETPNLARLRDGGVDFTDHHATYPTFTMMNSASLATGAFPDATGYFGNVVWAPRAQGKDSAGKPVDFRQPVFSEDYAVLDDLKDQGGGVLAVDTLFAAAQRAGMVTLALGKSGAAYLQDARRGGLLVDEKAVLPLDLAKELQAAGLPLPPTAPVAFAPGELELGRDNGNPVDFKPPQRMRDGVSSDPTDASGSRYKVGTEYVVSAYVEDVLPARRPRLSLVWLREPDSTQHAYGIGTPNWHDAMRSNDALLGRILAKLDELGARETTDVLVVSDHGHSNVSGPPDRFPLHAVRDGEVAAVDAEGHSISGMVRLADLLRRKGFNAYDGLGCTYLPIAMGIRPDGAPVYPTRTDADGSVCGKPGQKYQVAPLKVPAQLPENAVVVAVNGGSDYIYVPDHDPDVVRKVVAFLQTRAEVGAVFVDDRYHDISGTLPLGAIHAQDPGGKHPDIILSYDYDEDALIDGVRGRELAGVLLGNGYRGMHGSFSPRDVHNTLIAFGPDFRRGFKDPLPTGNVDVAPTVARILGVPLPQAQGRPLLEAMAGGAAASDYRVEAGVLRPAAPATGLRVQLGGDPDGNDLDPAPRSYSFELRIVDLRYRGSTYRYFDSAKAARR
jgi:arylsulfatase A-like enzyme